MNDFGYKSELKNTITSVNRSLSLLNDEEFEEKAFLNRILTLFQNESNLALINKGISELNKAILSNKTISFRSFFIELDIIKYLFDFIQSNSFQNSTKIEIINIFKNVIDWYDEESAIEISKLSVIDSIYCLMQYYFPDTDENREKIDSLQTILCFLTKLSNISIESRDSILFKYPNSDTNLLNPFTQLFEIIEALSEIESLQSSYISFFASLCYYTLDFEMVNTIYTEYVIKMFDNSIVKYDLWEHLLPIIRFFLYNGYGKIVGERDCTYQILIEAIVNGNSKAASTALIILDMLVDLNFDVFNYLDIPYLCGQVTDSDVKKSVGTMNLIEVVITPATKDFVNDGKNEDQSEKETPKESDIFSDPLVFLFKNNILSQLKSVLIDGCYKQKVSSLKVIMAIFRRKQTTFSPESLSKKIIKENLITPILEILLLNENGISYIVCDILSIIFEYCVNDNQLIADILLQINENGENLLIDLSKKLNEENNEEYQSKLEFILNKIDEYKNKEEIISLIFSSKDETDEDGDGSNLQNTNDEEEENSILPFNQGTRKRGELKSLPFI